MIITCINCDKKFNVNSELIPNKGRTIQCGSCNHVWFFIKNDHDQNNENLKKPLPINKNISKTTYNPNKKNKKSSPKIDTPNYLDYSKNKKGSEIVKYKAKSNFTFVKFLSYILVLIISFVGLILILDTFKAPLYDIFPKLEFFLFSLYETLKDVELFIKDLF